MYTFVYTYIYTYSHIYVYTNVYTLKIKSVPRGNKSGGHERWSIRPCV